MDTKKQPRNPKRRRFLKRSLGLLLGAGGSSLAYGWRYGAKHPVVERVAVPIAHLPEAAEGLRIIQLSDIHLHPYTDISLVRAVVEQVNSLKPDLVVLTGDYVLRQASDIFELAPVLATMNTRHGIFSVLGNHDLWTSKKTVTQGLVKAGIPVLENTGLVLGSKNPLLYLAGTDDGWSGHPDWNAALEKRTDNLPTVLLLHELDFADTSAQDPRIALQLSGHSHGGQIRIPGVGALKLPLHGRKYDMGLYRVGQMWLYTTRGVGVTGIPIRLNCRPEITELTLTATTT